ncbi:hypothetical protein RFI_31081 [Reticulomyxa filosa]|uniref:Kelch motif family protein n=1 Tax=Reticulomyxa filosa TaxID=46433 RepID=X6LZZ6_RETFI|nr:hypothetical protein RFI_31081 [Reticulomyxa filosa]|eukprot:ETO06315.1 hypothetical protein RFI_31081 [Reticulomyxa filosa]
MAESVFKRLLSLPFQFRYPKCVCFGDEILICCGDERRIIYSYHTVQNKYKKIAEYLDGVAAFGITLIKWYTEPDNKQNPESYIDDEISKCLGGHTRTKRSNINKWVEAPQSIENTENDMSNVATLIGGSNNHLLFVTYPPNQIMVLDSKSLHMLAKHTLPFYLFVGNHCIFNTNNDNKNELRLFNYNSQVVVRFDEHNNTWESTKFKIDRELDHAFDYPFVCIDGFVIIFGGCCNGTHSSSVKVYCIKTKRWKLCPHTLPAFYFKTCAILNADNTEIHIIGGISGNIIVRHLKIKVNDIIQMVDFSFDILKNNTIQQKNKIK